MWWNGTTNRRVVPHPSWVEPGAGDQIELQHLAGFYLRTTIRSRTDSNGRAAGWVAGRRSLDKPPNHQTTKPTNQTGQPGAGRAVNSVLCWLAMITRFVFQNYAGSYLITLKSAIEAMKGRAIEWENSPTQSPPLALLPSATPTPSVIHAPHCGNLTKLILERAAFFDCWKVPAAVQESKVWPKCLILARYD